MQVVALISGGKDSTFNMMRCIQEGHQIVALANLHPPSGYEELDSYMYQSVGHNVISSYAQAMDLPLYRAPIIGTPLNLAYEYEATGEDEVEDLWGLLARVKKDFPNLEGVSSGAILSTYQKNRVENVCSRLGLVSLAYLWEGEQSVLLQQMIDSQLHAIIIKVAAYGLDQGDLGKTLGELQPKLSLLAGKFGINVCGEGGEFESLTLDCPLFKKKIIIDEKEVVVHRNAGDTQVSFLKISKFHLEDKQ